MARTAKAGRRPRQYLGTVFVALFLGLSGCGQAKIAVSRPDHPLYMRCDGIRFDARRFLGKPIHEAEAEAEAKGCTVRVIVNDGRAVPITTEAESKRVNVGVRDGEIVRLYGFS
jgi:hypothetical protein